MKIAIGVLALAIILGAGWFFTASHPKAPAIAGPEIAVLTPEQASSSTSSTPPVEHPSTSTVEGPKNKPHIKGPTGPPPNY